MSYLNKSIVFLLLIFYFLLLAIKSSLAQPIYAHQLSYDQVPLSKQNWEEVDMNYDTTINGKPYLNTVDLLRPKSYLAQYHMNKVGQKLTLTLPEIGLNHNVVTITAIKPDPIFKRSHQKKCSQVIGLFEHYATNVKTYRFKDLTTQSMFIIHATPNHPFYVKNKHQFVPISEVSSHDQLVGDNNHPIQLLCATNQLSHCGVDYSKQNPVMVYNLEVYQQHHYRVGQEGILVHNDCILDPYGETSDENNLSEENDMNQVNHQSARNISRISKHSITLRDIVLDSAINYGESTAEQYIFSNKKKPVKKIFPNAIFLNTFNNDEQSSLQAVQKAAFDMPTISPQMKLIESFDFNDRHYLNSLVIYKELAHCSEESQDETQFLHKYNFEGKAELYRLENGNNHFTIIHKNYLTGL